MQHYFVFLKIISFLGHIPTMASILTQRHTGISKQGAGVRGKALRTAYSKLDVCFLTQRRKDFFNNQ
jgi:hypothetical protein